ncbi:MAG TPA: site-specific integrase [Sphingomicrobium sp.]|nr:site-specific integrase [Sphingomicrobium sp.]
MNRNAHLSRRLDGMALSPPEDPGCSTPARKRPKPLPSGSKKKAKAVPMEQVPGILAWLDCLGEQKEAAKVVITLSYYQALRPCEIAGLTIHDVTDHLGNVADVIRVPAGITKTGHGRDIPTHPATALAITAFRRKHPNAVHFALNAKGEPRNANALTVWLHRTYKQMGLVGCSGHSGRRSLITFLAKKHGELNMTMLDVQRIAGHARMDTTKEYIEPSPDLHRLIHSVPWAQPPVELNPPLPLREKAPPLQLPALPAPPRRLPFSWEEHGYAPPAYGSDDGGRS